MCIKIIKEITLQECDRERFSLWDKQCTYSTQCRSARNRACAPERWPDMAAAPSKPSATRLPYSTPVKSIILCTGIFKSQNVGISLHSTVDTYPGQSRSPVASFSGQLLSRLGPPASSENFLKWLLLRYQGCRCSGGRRRAAPSCWYRWSRQQSRCRPAPHGPDKNIKINKVLKY